MDNVGIYPAIHRGEEQVEKIFSPDYIPGMPSLQGQNRRGANIYTWSDVYSITGKDKHNQTITGEIERPLFGLRVEDRIDMMRLSADVSGIVTSRANKISGLNWIVKYKRNDEDRLAEKLKCFSQIWKERDGDTLQDKIIRVRMWRAIKEELVDIKFDLSNFQAALSRWGRRLKAMHEDRSTGIEDWISEPNQGEDFETFAKKWVQDCMIHGTYATYKEFNNDDMVLNNFYLLPGGSIIPLRPKFVGGVRGFVQMIAGIDTKIYFEDEILFGSYVPSSSTTYGLIPLEALINKIAETLLFDRYAAERSDGAAAPEKVLVLGNTTPFGNFSNAESYTVDPGEQKRIEIKLNEVRKEGVAVLTGYANANAIDLGKTDLYAHENERQTAIKQAIALVFNMSNMEINETGAEGTSGRNTSDAQAQLEKEKGIYPMVVMYENMMNRGIIPYRFGSDYEFTFDSGLSDKEKFELEVLMQQTKTYSTNEIRTKRGDDPYPEPEYDRPDKGGPAGQPGASEQNPLMTKAV
jgi:phage portal protein BeeE